MLKVNKMFTNTVLLRICCIQYKTRRKYTGMKAHKSPTGRRSPNSASIIIKSVHSRNTPRAHSQNDLSVRLRYPLTYK